MKLGASLVCVVTATGAVVFEVGNSACESRITWCSVFVEVRSIRVWILNELLQIKIRGCQDETRKRCRQCSQGPKQFGVWEM